MGNCLSQSIYPRCTLEGLRVPMAVPKSIEEEQYSTSREESVAAKPVVGSEFCSFKPAQYTLFKSGFLSCGEYKVVDVKKDVMFKTAGTFGCCRELLVSDAHGGSLLTLQKQGFSFQHKWKALLNKDETVVFTVKKPCFQFNFCINVYLGPESSNKPDYELKGCCFTRKYRIIRVADGDVIAKAKKKCSLGTLVGCNTYYIEVGQGVDSAFVMSLFVIMNEIFIDRAAGGGVG